MDYKVSIIVPVYNTSEYLDECVTSLRNQIYTNIEIILVNDGSTDNSGEICDKYAESDKRIKVVHKKNGGVSEARNIGIEVSTGEYLCFVDSDDYVSNQYIQDFMGRDYPPNVFVQQGYFDKYTSSIVEKSSSSFNKLYYVEDISLLNVKTAKIPFMGFTFVKLYDAQTIKSNNLRFEIGISSFEDSIFYFDYLLHTDCVCSIPKANYYYRHVVNRKSLNTTLKSSEEYSKIISKILDRLEDIIAHFNISGDYKKKCYNDIALYLMNRQLMSMAAFQVSTDQYQSFINKYRFFYSKFDFHDGCLDKLIKFFIESNKINNLRCISIFRYKYCYFKSKCMLLLSKIYHFLIK